MVHRNLWPRVGVFAGGMYFAVYGLSLLDNGVFEFHNYLRAVVHSPGIVMSGILLMILAVIPDSLAEWTVARRGRRR
jgi:hypothetical protein